ncbi:MAG TPA: hypothetical protein DCG14_05715 [Phycisphaerales bacterium]|nr:hypothetical protein [Phycisphaerales bacterium]
MRRKPIPSRSWTQLLFAGVWISLTAVGCGSEPAPASASNEFLGDRPDSGVNIAGEDDRWASAAPDEQQFEEVRRALRDVVAGNPPPLEVAPHGIRFEDVPQAILTAAPEVELAITGQRLNPAVATVRFKDGAGRAGTAKIELRRTRTLVSIAFLTGMDADSLRIQQAVERRIRSSSGYVGRSTADRRRSSTESKEGTEAIAILEEAVRNSGGTVDSREFEPEIYEIDLLMLDNQPARLVVRREPDPKVLSWKAWAGIFGDATKAESLGRAFGEALRAWGKVPQPVQPDPFESD